MQETKHHIPAPWAFEPENDGLPVIVDASGNDIAHVRDGWDGMTTYAEETIRANAHMLRAAPELFEALETENDACLLDAAIEKADWHEVVRVIDRYSGVLHQEMTGDEALLQLTALASNRRINALRKARGEA